MPMSLALLGPGCSASRPRLCCCSMLGRRTLPVATRLAAARAVTAMADGPAAPSRGVKEAPKEGGARAVCPSPPPLCPTAFAACRLALPPVCPTARAAALRTVSEAADSGTPPAQPSAASACPRPLKLQHRNRRLPLAPACSRAVRRRRLRTRRVWAKKASKNARPWRQQRLRTRRGRSEKVSKNARLRRLLSPRMRRARAEKVPKNAQAAGAQEN